MFKSLKCFVEWKVIYYPHKSVSFAFLIAEEKEGCTSSNSECLETNWTSTMDCYLIELLQDQVLRGNKIGHGFVSEAWIEMVGLFNAKFECHHDKDGLRNRYKHLRGRYNDIKVLLDQGGFSCDEMGEMVTAEDYVWDSYTKVNCHLLFLVSFRYL